jgi:peptide/nickel transport system permease protein
MLDGKNYITSAWWMTLFPGIAIMLTSLSLVLIGDGLEARTEGLRARESDG